MRLSGKVLSLGAWRNRVVRLIKLIDFGAWWQRRLPEPYSHMYWVCWISYIVVFCLDTRKNGQSRTFSRFLAVACCIYHLNADMHAVGTDSLVRLGTNHPRGGGCRMVAVSRNAYSNSKPTHILLALHRSSELSAPIEEAPPFPSPPPWRGSVWPGLWGLEGSTDQFTANVSAVLCNLRFFESWPGGHRSYQRIYS